MANAETLSEYIGRQGLPKPATKLDHGERYFLPDLTYNSVLRCEFDSTLDRDYHRLRRGICFTSYADAVQCLNIFSSMLERNKKENY